MSKQYFFSQLGAFKMVAAATIVSLLLSALPAAFFVALAANTDAVGTITVSVMPHPAPSNPEYFTVSFSGTGTLNLNGWTVSDTLVSPGLVYTFSGTTLTNGQTFKVCGNNSPGNGCDDMVDAGGNANWNNPGDTLVLRDDTNTQVLTVTYSPAVQGQLESNTVAIDYDTSVPKTVTEIDVSSNTSVGENLPGWMFNRDARTSTPHVFNTAASSLGTGSLYAGPITNTNSGGVVGNDPNRDKFIAEYFPGTLAVADFTEFKYDFKIGAGGDASDANQFYVNVYVNTDNSTNFYDCRYDYAVLSATVGSFNTASVLPAATPTHVQLRGTRIASCPATLAGMPAGSHIRAIAINMGETTASDTGLDAHFDKAVLETTTNITTFDFEPLPVCELVVKSDTVDYVEEKNILAKTLTFVHSAWLQVLPGSMARWIWGDDPVVNPTVVETQTFVKKFNWTGGTPTSATLRVVSDNGHAVTLGAFTGGSVAENSYIAAANYNVASGIVAGENTLRIAVTNLATPSDPSPQNNPAGLMYELVVRGEGSSCGSVTPITPVVHATLAITNPAADDQVVAGPYDFTAIYVDNDPIVDTVLWAIRAGTCSASTGTVAGNVDGFNSASTFVGNTFTAPVDTSTFEPGRYCFVVNPAEQAGEPDLRASRWFVIEEPPVSDVTLCKYEDSVEEGQGLVGWQLALLGGLVDTVTVPSEVPGGANSNVMLEEDMNYVLKASGTWTNGGQGANFVDAEYSTVDNWVTAVDGFTGYSDDILELQVNGQFGEDWGPYNGLHSYLRALVPTDTAAVNFRVFDGLGETPNPDWYGDNQGDLSVEVFEGYTGITGEDGCVTFENVPHGEYFFEEVEQDGWEFVSGGGEIMVGGESSVFNIINRDADTPLSCSIEMNSGTGTVVVERNGYAVPTYVRTDAWTADIEGATWVWDSFQATEIDDGEEEIFTFRETFTVNNPQEAELDIAADNDYQIVVNGVTVDEFTGESNFNFLQKDDISLTGYLVSGANTVEFRVKNFGMNNTNYIQNPAGVLYKLVVEGETGCSVTTRPTEDPGGGETDTYRIEGYAWFDDNRNQEWDGFNEASVENSDEGTLAGWQVTITNGTDTFTTTTDTEGAYFFEVPAGTWTVTIEDRGGWRYTTETSYEITVPVVTETPPGPLTSLMRFVVPTAYAAVLATYGPFNFGIDRSSGGGNTVNKNPSNTPDGDVAGVSTSTSPTPLVLGDQVSAVPVGAPNTGRGGAASLVVNGQFLVRPRRLVPLY